MHVVATHVVWVLIEVPCFIVWLIVSTHAVQSKTDMTVTVCLFLLQNKLMQQPLCHLYFLTVMEDLKDSSYGLSGLVKTIHNISKVSKVPGH